MSVGSVAAVQMNGQDGNRRVLPSTSIECSGGNVDYSASFDGEERHLPRVYKYGNDWRCVPHDADVPCRTCHPLAYRWELTHPVDRSKLQ